MRPGRTEYAIFFQFELGLFPHNPLGAVERLGNPDYPIPISFMYGDRDWMDAVGSAAVVDGNKFKETGESQLHIVPNAGHQMA